RGRFDEQRGPNTGSRELLQRIGRTGEVVAVKREQKLVDRAHQIELRSAMPPRMGEHSTFNFHLSTLNGWPPNRALDVGGCMLDVECFFIFISRQISPATFSIPEISPPPGPSSARPPRLPTIGGG